MIASRDVLREGLKSLTRVLLVARLCGDVMRVNWVKEYLLDGLSPSEIGHRYKASRIVVRGFVQRAVQKLCNNEALAREAVARLYPAIMKLNPVILKMNGTTYCLLCNTKVVDPRNHLLIKHRDYIEELVEKVIEEARKQRYVT